VVQSASQKKNPNIAVCGKGRQYREVLTGDADNLYKRSGKYIDEYKIFHYVVYGVKVDEATISG
jgi:hypothetical protein